MDKKMDRRSFLQKSALLTAGLTVVPSLVMGKKFGYMAPSDKLNIAAVGIGGMGNANISAVKNTENIVALCDVDWGYSKKVFENFPNAKKYWDWRKMYDEMGKSIDAVIVATADHTHAIIAATAMTLGKHVYVQKPLTHSVYESRLLTKLAAKHKVATQMGNQGSSDKGVRQICDWIAAGEIGDVRKVECATNRPIWPQGLNTPTKGSWVPETLNWELFLGPAKKRPFNEIYHPWNWRGWWDYGTGALGDMACHIMHPVFKGLKLGYPTKVQGSSTLLLSDCAPTAQSVRLLFPARPQHDTKKIKYPEVEVFWTDGGITPLIPKGMPKDKRLDVDGPVIFHGTKDTLICGCYGRSPWLLSGRKPEVPKTQREVTLSHEMDWVRACKESPENRVLTASDFSEAGPFNEMVVMGVLAVRLQSLHKELEWDGVNMQFTNIGDNDKFGMVLSDDFKVVDGHPTFDKPSTEINAKEFAAELIKHTYQNGYSLPAMP
ncbi:MAG: Gfo/Idh/MocA family oxidoreductase [Prevotellaceae bacterium]|jgi:hypothetical protein|nr:Gfo/Idh/MocA family oxidoreductase [Prevotellaceae bacterium]